jgi:hydroxymethylglutaryl-CoA lyase
MSDADAHEFVRLTDVAPRDGLQNEPAPIPTAGKATLVDFVAATGVDEVEVTSFVSPKWVPQLGDAAELCAAIAPHKPSDVVFSALVPNAKGFDRLNDVNAEAQRSAGTRVIDRVCLFTAASETFSAKNTNATIGETFERFLPVVGRVIESELSLKLYVSCAWACPYEGAMPAGQVAAVLDRLLKALPLGSLMKEGRAEVSLADTIGAASPDGVSDLLAALPPALPIEAVNLHLHDTHGRASACVRAALDAGVRSFDGSSGGLGGCPYASTAEGGRAPGNIAMPALVRTIRDAGFATRIDDDRLEQAQRYAQSLQQQAADGAGAIGGAT